MQVKIISENNLIKFYAQNDIKVNELLNSLKNNKSLNYENKNLLILDKDHNILQNEDIISLSFEKNKKEEENNFNIKLSNNDFIQTQPEIILYLIAYDISKSKKYESEEDFNSIKYEYRTTDITDLIMLTTNAKEKISMFTNKNLHLNVGQNRMRIFDFLNSNLNSLSELSNLGNNNSGTNHLNELLNILRPMIDIDDVGGIGSSSSNNIPRRIPLSRTHFVNVVPDENLVNNLKEMGFPEEQCRRALIASRNDISRATDLLLSDGLDYLPNEKYYF